MKMGKSGIENIIEGLLAPRPTPKSSPKRLLYPLAVFPHKRRGIFILCKQVQEGQYALCLLGSTNGRSFSPSPRDTQILSTGQGPERLEQCSDFYVTPNEDGYVMTYLRTYKDAPELVTATSPNLYEWRIEHTSPYIRTAGAVVPHHTRENYYVLYHGRGSINTSLSHKLTDWQPHKKNVVRARVGAFDSEFVSVLGVGMLGHGTLLVYDCSRTKNDGMHLQLGGVLFSKKRPNHITWRSDTPLWEQAVETKTARPIGAVITDKGILVYWSVAGQGLLTANIPNPFRVVDGVIGHHKPKLFQKTGPTTALIPMELVLESTLKQ